MIYLYLILKKRYKVRISQLSLYLIFHHHHHHHPKWYLRNMQIDTFLHFFILFSILLDLIILLECRLELQNESELNWFIDINMMSCYLKFIQILFLSACEEVAKIIINLLLLKIVWFVFEVTVTVLLHCIFHFFFFFTI